MKASMRFGELRPYIAHGEKVIIQELNSYLGDGFGVRELFRGEKEVIPKCIDRSVVLSLRMTDGVLDIFLLSREEEEIHGLPTLNE